MRKWVWLAAATLVIVTTPAMAETGPGPSPFVNTADSMTQTALAAAAAKMDAGDYKGAETDFDALVAGAHFAGAMAETRAKALTLLGFCESVNEKPEAAFRHLTDVATIDPDARTGYYWMTMTFVASALNKDETLADALTNTAIQDPKRLNFLSPSLVFNAIQRTEKLKDGKAHRRRLLEALIMAPYAPADDPGAGESLKRDLFELYADTGEDAKARALLPNLHDPDTVIALRADTRYRKYVVADASFNDFKAVQDRYIAELRAQQSTGGLPAAQALALALKTADRLPEALQVVDAALASNPSAPSDGSDPTKWLLDTRTHILALMGRWDEVEASQVKARDTALKEGNDLVSQKINLADFYNRLGRPKDALKELSDLRPEDASLTGQMIAEQVRACAYAGLGEKDKLKISLATLRAHNDKAPGMLADALVCVGDEAGIAAVLIGYLNDPDQRARILVSAQTYLPPPHPTAYDQMVTSHIKSALRRPDVQAAIAKYGVIDSYPEFSPDN